jgi:hypothetical protein
MPIMDATQAMAIQDVQYSQLDADSRSQAFMGAFFFICNSVHVTLQVHATDAQLLEAKKPPIRRLLSSIVQVNL